MSFDLAIWRRAPTAKTAMIVEVYDVLGDGEHEHPAVGMFDAQEFVTAAGEMFGRLPESGEDPTQIYVADDAGEVASVSLWAWTGRTSAAVHVSGPFPWRRSAIGTLLPLVEARNLMLYDPHFQTVYNNRRQYPELRAER
ncbi:hypothetical protein [Cellulomonas sp. URHD0024]|uniref:hypothetical protein n=1 Tax=Cellulomonas sp. URHD0024 TaxID=1302620 RepID=UPI0004215618|nr:hypothetical protein [Cellulomonas sp. URHD0024]